MNKWSNPDFSVIDVSETNVINCPYFKPDPTKIFNPDDVTNNCKNCVEVGAQSGDCKYIGHDNAFCS